MMYQKDHPDSKATVNVGAGDSVAWNYIRVMKQRSDMDAASGLEIF